MLLSELVDKPGDIRAQLDQLLRVFKLLKSDLIAEISELSLFDSNEAAVGSLPLILIPQIVFGGLIVTIKDMPVVAQFIASLTVTRWSFETLIKSGERLLELNARFASKDPVASAPPVSSSLYHLGFRSTDPADMGLSLLALDGILIGMAFCFFVATLLVLRFRLK